MTNYDSVFVSVLKEINKNLRSISKSLSIISDNLSKEDRQHQFESYLDKED